MHPVLCLLAIFTVSRFGFSQISPRFFFCRVSSFSWEHRPKHGLYKQPSPLSIRKGWLLKGRLRANTARTDKGHRRADQSTRPIKSTFLNWWLWVRWTFAVWRTDGPILCVHSKVCSRRLLLQAIFLGQEELYSLLSTLWLYILHVMEMGTHRKQHCIYFTFLHSALGPSTSLSSFPSGNENEGKKKDTWAQSCQ